MRQIKPSRRFTRRSWSWKHVQQKAETRRTTFLLASIIAIPCIYFGGVWLEKALTIIVAVATVASAIFSYFQFKHVKHASGSKPKIEEQPKKAGSKCISQEPSGLYSKLGHFKTLFKNETKQKQVQARKAIKIKRSVSDRYHEAMKIIKTDRSEAAQLLLINASEGHLNSIFKLAELYYFWDGIRNYREKAFDFYLKAARMGHSHAQMMLGVQFRKGSGVRQNHKKALHWFTESANNGKIRAKIHLAEMHRFGEGVPINRKLATDLYLEVAKQTIDSQSRSEAKSALDSMIEEDLKDQNI